MYIQIYKWSLSLFLSLSLSLSVSEYIDQIYANEFHFATEECYYYIYHVRYQKTIF